MLNSRLAIMIMTKRRTSLSLTDSLDMIHIVSVVLYITHSSCKYVFCNCLLPGLHVHIDAGCLAGVLTAPADIISTALAGCWG